jgi:hypothetical protein
LGKGEVVVVVVGRKLQSVPGLAEGDVSTGVEQRVLGRIEADDAFVAAVLLLLFIFIFACSRLLGFRRCCLGRLRGWRWVNRPLRRLRLRMGLWRLGRGLYTDGAVTMAVADSGGGRVGHAGGVLEQQLVFGVEDVAAAGAVSTSLVVPRPSTDLVSRDTYDSRHTRHTRHTTHDARHTRHDDT